MLTIVTISYNSKDTILRCLATLIDASRYQVIIVDNASSDNSAEILEERFPDATVISLKQNIGYGRAANIGLRKAETRFAMLLNPDLLAGLSEIQELLDYANRADPSAAVFAPAVRKKDFFQAPPEPVQWISGSAMLFDLKKMESIGLFDENIFLFSEETDLCRRTVTAGYKIMLCHSIYVEHLKGQSSTLNAEVEYMKSWHFGWSYSYYFTKHQMATGKKNPHRRFWKYTLKWITATTPLKRLKYKARAAGTRAFIKGETAFLPNGNPKAAPDYSTSS